MPNETSVVGVLPTRYIIKSNAWDQAPKEHYSAMDPYAATLLLECPSPSQLAVKR